MAVTAYVVNVPPTVDPTLHDLRRAHMESELGREEIPHRFVRSVDGARLTPSQRATLIDEEHVSRNEWLTPGILGASLSHLEAYREILRDGHPAGLVLEDDAVLPRGTAALLDQIVAEMSGAEVVLLYWRSQEPAVLSRQDAVDLGGGRLLCYPQEIGGLGCASAYLVTADACRRLLETLTPVRSCTDTWAIFHGWGGFDRLRCVVPRPVGSRTDFKSTVNYHGASRLRSAISGAVARHRIFPLHQAFALLRGARERRTSRFTFTDERSSLASRG